MELAAVLALIDRLVADAERLVSIAYELDSLVATAKRFRAAHLGGQAEAEPPDGAGGVGPQGPAEGSAAGSGAGPVGGPASRG